MQAYWNESKNSSYCFNINSSKSLEKASSVFVRSRGNCLRIRPDRSWGYKRNIWWNWIKSGYGDLMENISKKLFLCCWYFMAYNYEVNLCIIWKYIGEYVWRIKNWYVICFCILSCLNSKVRKILIISQAIHCEFRCCICYT